MTFNVERTVLLKLMQGQRRSLERLGQTTALGVAAEELQLQEMSEAPSSFCRPRHSSLAGGGGWM